MRQRQALQVMLSGNNTFLTGAPGAGKTYVLNDFINRSLRLGKRIAVTASTGIAASHIGGTTIHSWSGLGILDFLSEEDKKRLGASEKLIKRYNGVDILVIDEVSMLHGARLDMISTVAKMLRKSDKPFGGLQVILVGDLFQLPPVSRGVQKFDFIHHAEAWQELDLKICYITEQHRQTADDQLLKFLELMRFSELNEINGEIVTSRVGLKPKDGQVITRLYSHNIDVESINKQHLDAIPTAPKTFQMQTKGSSAKVEQLTKGLLANEVL
ncbi:MAG: AAA family ATPase, partial [bacterium]